jgi:hypothetical protein
VRTTAQCPSDFLVLLPLVPLVRSLLCPNTAPHASTTGNARGADLALNGTYDAHVFTNEAIRLLEEHDQTRPWYMYLAYQVRETLH